jgi:o-succinylbenzoate synthase
MLMKIDAITLYHVRLPYVSPFQTSRWTETHHECVIVRIQSQGLSGWGECSANAQPAYSYETVKTNWHILSDFIVPALLKQTFSLPTVQPPGMAFIQPYVDGVDFINGHPMAKAGPEMALWDLAGQASGHALQRMLGGELTEVKVGVSVGIQPTLEALVETVAAYLMQGYTRVKLKIKPGRDVDDVAAVRRAFPGLLLQVDGNSVYRLADATHLRELDEFGLLLIEQPLGADDILDHAKLQSQLKTDLCLDESIHSREAARWALELGACRVINIKPPRVGGIHEAVAIHDFCHGRGVPVWMGGMLETGIGRAANVAVASLPGFRLPGDISATRRYYAEDIIRQPFTLNPNSTLSVPTGPGLGVQVAEEVLARYVLRQETFKPE